jgi:hypothetical protein
LLRLPSQHRATDVLVYLSSTEAAVKEIVAAGAFAVLIRNLKGSAKSAEDLEQAMDDDEDDLAAVTAANAAAFTARHAAELVSSSLFLVASLCAVESHIPAGEATS